MLPCHMDGYQTRQEIRRTTACDEFLDVLDILLLLLILLLLDHLVLPHCLLECVVVSWRAQMFHSLAFHWHNVSILCP